MTKSLTFLIKFLIILSHNVYAQSSRVSCGSNQWCYNMDIQPTGIGLTSQTITIYSDVSGTTTNHDVTINNIGDDCVNPAISVRYEEIDFDSSGEYFNVYDDSDSLIQQCQGTQQNGCGIWGTCINNYGLPISQIDANDTYSITIQGSSGLHALCSSSLSLNVNLTITCGSMATTPSPTTAEPSDFFTTTDSPTTAEPTSSSCGGANTYCYYVDLYPSSGINTVPVILQSTTIDTIEYFEIYVTSNGGVCNEPYLDIRFQEIDYSAGKPVEYFDVFDQNGSIIVTCEGTQDSQCTFLTCASGLDIGPSFIAADDTYQITVQTGYEHDPFCNQNSFTLNAIINVTCDSTRSPTSPTLPPTSPAPTQEPTIEPTAPSVPTTAIPTTQDICNVSLTVVNDWPISKMNGWTVCYDEPYSDYTYPSSFSSCVTGDGYYLFVGAKATSTSQTFYVGAYAPSSVITTITSSNSVAYLPSWYPGYNVYWYYYSGRSFGFAPISTISLNSADTYDTSDIQRLSWHFGQNVGGWRAGDNTGLNSNTVWRKVVYYKACSIAPTPPTTSPTTAYPITALPTLSPTVPTAQPTPSPTDSRQLCGTNTWCYYVDIEPQGSGSTTEIVEVYSETSGLTNYHKIYITSIGDDCANPAITVRYEEIDFDQTSEYFNVYDDNDNLIQQCQGTQQVGCEIWGTCFSNYFLPISQIDANDTYLITIEGSSALHPLCTAYNSSLSLNVELEIICSGTTAPTTEPTTIEPTTPEPSPSPTVPTRSPTTGYPTTAYPTPDVGCNVSLDIVNELPVSSLNGWTICYDEPYSDYTYPASFSSCATGAGYFLFVGAKKTSSSQTFYIGAYAPSSVITTATSSNSIAYLPSWYAGYSVHWYYYSPRSFGFAPNSTIELNSADVFHRYNADRNDRLSWHFGQSIGGWRAGNVTGLNYDTTWRKVMYYKYCVPGQPTVAPINNTVTPAPTIGNPALPPNVGTTTDSPTPFGITTPQPTPATSNGTTRVLCGTYTWCYYVDIYPSSTIKTSKTVGVNTIVENTMTYHQIYITSNGNDCVDPTINVIYEEIDFASTSEYFDVYANKTFIAECQGTSDADCGVFGTCLDNYSLPIKQINMDDTYLIEIENTNNMGAFCFGDPDYALNIFLTITCSISEEKYCDNVDCGWSFLCDEDTQSCVRDCDAFDIDGYLKCSESWAIVEANISSIVDRVNAIDEADESLDDLRAQLDEINEKIERLSRPFREELNGGHANINPMSQEITDDHSKYKYPLLNTFEPHDILIIVLLISNLILINYICLCQRNNKSGVKYIKTIQEENIEDRSESDSEASENEQLN